MAQFLTSPVFQVLDANGNPYAGAKMYVYQTGTTTLLSLFSDEAMTTPATNPVVADSSGTFANVFLSQTKFKAVITSSADTTIKTLDPVYSTGASDSVSAEQVSFDGTSIGFAATTVQDAIEEVADTTALLTGSDFTGPVTITRDVTGNHITLTSTEASAASGPVIEFYRNSASPAASDVAGSLAFYGEDSAGNKEQYAEIRNTITDPTTTEEDGTLTVRTIVAGTLADRVHIGAGLYTQGTTGSDKGAGTVNSTLYDNTYRVAEMFLTSGTAAATASVTINLSTFITAGFSSFRLEFDNFEPATDNITLDMTVSTDGGSNFASTNYRYALHYIVPSGTAFGGGSNSGSAFTLISSQGNATDERGYGIVRMRCGATWFSFVSEAWHITDGGNASSRRTAGDIKQGSVNAIKLAPSSGNFDTLSYWLYGIRTS